MRIREKILLASLAIAVFSFGASPWLWTGRDLRGHLPGCPSLFLGYGGSPCSSWSPDKINLVAATDKDNKDSDSDKKDADDKDNWNDRLRRELWDLVLLG